MLRTSSKVFAIVGVLLLGACSDDNNNDDEVVPPPPPAGPTAIQDTFGATFSTAFKADPNTADPIDVKPGDLIDASLTTDPTDF